MVALTGSHHQLTFCKMDMLKKALETNGCKILELSEPRFNPICIQQKIDALDKEIEFLRSQAFSPFGVNVVILKSKIAIRESLICNLKSLELLNK